METTHNYTTLYVTGVTLLGALVSKDLTHSSNPTSRLLNTSSPPFTTFVMFLVKPLPVLT